MSDSSGRWVLLVEDDPIFAMLFCRFWRAADSRVEVSVAKDLAQMKHLIEKASQAPSLVIFDRNLPDGDGHAAAKNAAWPTHCWSALAQEQVGVKPQGKDALRSSVEALLEIVQGESSTCPPSEGSSRRSQE